MKLPTCVRGWPCQNAGSMTATMPASRYYTNTISSWVISRVFIGTRVGDAQSGYRLVTTEALRRLKLLFLDCGSDDEYHLHLGMRLFAKRCAELGVPCEALEFPDDHRSISYRYDVSVPKLARALTPRT